MAETDGSRLAAMVSCTSCTFQRQIPISKHRIGATLQCPQCKTVFVFRPEKLVFDQNLYENIHPDAIMHPLDKAAIATLRKVPGLDFAVRKMMEFGYEKIIRVTSMADDVKVTPNTYSHIHDMSEQAAKSLGIQVPDVYVNQDPVPNAWTIGTEFPIVKIQSGLIELLTEDELYAVVAHEIGHIKCHHVLYHMLADFLRGFAGALGMIGFWILPLNLALLEWSRKSELSADRASLLVTNNRPSIITLLMKLAGGSRDSVVCINEDEFVVQAEKFEKLTEGIGLNKFYKVASSITRTHPFPVLRGHEIHKWAQSDEYASIRQGNYQRREEAARDESEIRNCPQCGAPLVKGELCCGACGQRVQKLKNQFVRNGAEEFGEAIRKAKDFCRTLFGRRIPGQELLGIGRCPKCGQQFDDPLTLYCPDDGSELVANTPAVSQQLICPTCKKVFYDSEALFCPEDGARLVKEVGT